MAREKYYAKLNNHSRFKVYNLLNKILKKGKSIKLAEDCLIKLGFFDFLDLLSRN